MTPHHVFRQAISREEADFEGFGGLEFEDAFRILRVEDRRDAVEFVAVRGFGVEFLAGENMEEFQVADFQADLFPHFPDGDFLKALAELHESPWKAPSAFRTLLQQHLSPTVSDDHHRARQNERFCSHILSQKFIVFHCLPLPRQKLSFSYHALPKQKSTEFLQTAFHRLPK